MAITAGVITWWVMRGRSDRSREWFGAADTSWDYDEYEPIEQVEPRCAIGPATFRRRRASESATTP